MAGIQKKLRSERGASITFALLLFLVCAAVGSVILTAATAASGRFSSLAESDQRYYSVTSAARLLKEKYGRGDNAAVTVVKETVTTSTATYNYEDELKNQSIDDPITTKTINGTVADYDYKLKNFFEEAASRWLENGTFVTSGQSIESEYTFTVDDEDVEKAVKDAVEVSVHEYLYEDGTIELQLEGTAGTGNGGGTGGEGGTSDAFRMRMTFVPDIQQKTDTKTQEGTPQDVGTSGYNVTTTTTVTETTLMTWKLTGIETVSGDT